MSNGLVNVIGIPPIQKKGQVLTSTDFGTEWVDPVSGGGGAGISSSGEFMYESTPTEPPTGSEIRMDNANQTLATKLWVKTITVDGIDASAVLSLVNDSYRIYVQDKDDSTKFQLYDATGNSIMKTGYAEIPVTWIRGGTALTEQRVLIAFVPGGNLSAYQLKSEKGQPNGYVGFDGSKNIAGIPGYFARTGVGTIAFATADVGDIANRWLMDNNGKMNWGIGSTAADTVLYRRQAGVLATDGGFYVNTASGYLGVLQPGDVGLRFSARFDGYLQWGPGNTGADTGLSRVAAGVLQTDGVFYAAGRICASLNNTGQVYLGNTGPGATAGILFGNAQDTNIYRQAAGVLRTDGYVQAGAASGTSFLAEGSVWVGHASAGTTPVNGIYFGSAADTNLYRFAANQLKTDGSFNAGAHILLLSDTGKLFFGATGDTSLYRVGANQLTTPGLFYAQGQIWGANGGLFWNNNLISRYNEAYQVEIGLVSSMAQPGLIFGNANTANLYRYAAGVLAIGDTVSTPGGLEIMGPALGNTNALQIRAWNNNATPIFGIASDGTMRWAAPGGSLDTSLYRYTANWLVTNGNLSAGWTKSPGNASIGAFSSGDGWARVSMDNDGYVRFSPGNAGSDTNLYRLSAGHLKTDGGFQATDYGLGPIVPGNDCNGAVNVGWYFAQPGTGNAPPGGSYYGILVINVTSPTQVRQIAYDYQTNDVWMRRLTAGIGWQPWVRTWPISVPGISQLAYAANTSGVTASVSGTVVVDTGAVTYDGSPVVVEFFAPGVGNASATFDMRFYLQDNTVSMGSIAVLRYNGAGDFITPVFGKIRLTPSAGSHSYRVVATTISGANVGVIPDGSVPISIRVTQS